VNHTSAPSGDDRAEAINVEQPALFKAASRLPRVFGMKAKEKAKSDRIFVFED
jgi:hypothetical protein